MKSGKVFLDMFCILFFVLLCGMCLTSNPAVAADKTVCETGCDHDTIQAAIDDAFDDVPSGGTITVNDSRTYNECITMEDGVNVTRLAGQTPTISCSGTAATVEFAPQTASMTCNLNGFEITHPTGVGAGIFLDGTSQSVTTTISNCNIHDIFDGVGIRLDGTVSCTIQDNTIYDCAEAGIGSSGTLSSGSSVTIEGNTIGALSPNHNQEAGIFIMGSGSVTVVIGSTGASNFIHFNGESGIRLDTITDLTIDNNTIRNNTKAGILLIDVGTSGVGNEAIVKNSTIQSNSKAGINIGGESYLIVGTNNIIFNNSTGGIAFNMGDVVLDPGAPSSGPVTVTGNDHINGNTFGGIGVIDAISTTNTVRITENTIYSNFRGGIGIQNDCKLEITKNTIRNNVRGGIKTGDDSIDPGGFSGTPGSANLTIKQNKVYGNGASGIGGGIDVRHAGGSIYNNLVYENHRGGIRFGDWIDEIVNNTVADNGNDNGTPADTDDNVGGGIIYDDISAGDPVNAQPAGNPPAPIPIRNNICTHNYRAGIRACFTNTEGSEERDYNLVYSNNATGATDCGWPDSLVMSCVNQNLGGCGGIWDLPDPPKVLMDGPNNKAADPLFENRTADDYRIQSDSPAVDAGDIAYGTDVSIPPGVGAPTIDMGAFGGPDGIDW